MFSKSFGYALSGILFLSKMHDTHQRIQVGEIASQLRVPRHFMGKILKSLAKHGILGSTKGPSGGFYINELTYKTTVFDILCITEGRELFSNCVLRFQACTAQNPCPLHTRIERVKTTLPEELMHTSVGDLLSGDKSLFIQSISSLPRITAPVINNL